MSNCRLCNRPLSHPRSVALQVGPVCAKKVRAVGEAVRERMEQAGTWDQSAAERIRPGSDGWFDLADVARLEYVTARAARAAERARALQQARQPEPPR